MGVHGTLGDGFRRCTQSSDDAWDDGAGSDVVSVVVSLIEGEAGAPRPPEPEIDLGRFVFEATGTPSVPEGVVFRDNDSLCHPPFDQTTKVFSSQGDTVPMSPVPEVTVAVVSTSQVGSFSSSRR